MYEYNAIVKKVVDGDTLDVDVDLGFGVKMPRPSYWSKELDKSFVNEFALPAFFEALKEIEDVDPCAGFDLKNIDIYD